MAMTLLNNTASLMTLGQLNKNITKVGKAITKVSTGQKINSASDDASAYGISEKMRVQIRGLEQAVSNIQNDSAMMRTAEGAVTSTLEIVRHMKEKAIDAANDSNSDDDRRTIQKEIDQCIDQVNENAQIKFNGKTLLDGSTSSLYMNMTDDKEAVIRGLSSAWINDALMLIDESWGINFNQPDNTFHKMQVKFVGTNEAEPSSDANAVAYVSASTNSDSLTLSINMDQVKNLNARSEHGEYAGSGSQYLDRVIAHEMTHAIMFSKIGVDKMGKIGNASLYILEGGTAEMTHGADDTRDLAGAAVDPFASGNQYAGGFVASRFLAKHIGSDPQDTMKKFMRGLVAGGTADGAFRYVSGGAFNEQGFKDMYNAAYAKYNGDNIAFLKNECGIDLTNADTGAVTGYDAGNRVVKNKYNVVSQASRPMNWSLPSSSMTMINGLEISWPKGYNANPTAGTMVFHTGTGANQAMKISFFDMSARSIGLIDEEGNKLNVSTIGNANQAIGQLDKIINVILDESTNIGAIQQRLGFTEANVTASTENTQGAESTIRDADMAKEMTEYSKSNVLSQAAQSMLTKANQAMSSVLSMITQNGNDTVEESQDTSEVERDSDEHLSEVGKDLQKVSSGQKINSAADDASAYGISEQMRVQIRGLDQDIQNVKNGSNMLQTALGGIDNIVDELRSLKELAINAANDSNTDLDRMTIQKEFDQRRATIDEIAITTNYNGKTLLDGTYANKTRAISINGAYDPDKATTEISKGFSAYFSASGGGNTESYTSDVNKAMCTSRYSNPDYPNDSSDPYLVGDIAFGSKGSWSANPLVGKSWENGLSTNAYFSDAITHMDFSNFIPWLSGNQFRDYMSTNGVGFTILCSGCSQYINFNFDATISAANSTRDRDPYTSSSTPINYTIGISQVNDSRGLAGAIFEGIAACNNKTAPSYYKSNISPNVDATLIDYNHSVNIYKENNNYYITKNSGLRLIVRNGNVGAPPPPPVPPPDNVRYIYPKELTIHHGTHANQRTHFYINDMRSKALRIDNAEVTTRNKATNAVGIIDRALQSAIDEATTMGSYLQRLDYTESNIVAEDENVQAAESTIRDADMAKEYTKYTKDSVLAQASQSMLAQANQNPKFVMSVI